MAFADEEVIAVICHSMLASMGVIKATTITVLEHWEDFTDDEKKQLLTQMAPSIDFVTDMMLDFIRGTPMERVPVAPANLHRVK